MTKFELLKSYVDYQIEEMHSAVDWARDHMEEHGKGFRQEWAFDMIEKEENDATGAIAFAMFWEKEISTEEKEQLTAILHREWKAARARVWNEI